MTEEQVQRAVDEFFAGIGLRRVISIDDMYGEQRIGGAEFLGLVRSVDAEVAMAVLGGDSGVNLLGDAEVADESLRRLWARLNQEQQTSTIDELRAKRNAKDDTDLVAKNKLARIFANQVFEGLSLQEWEARGTELLADERPLLLLVDEDFRKEGRGEHDGRAVIREILHATGPERAMCGLVSHNFGLDTVHEDRERLCSEEGFDASRFVLIPKALVDEDLSGFASLIKLALVAKPMDSLRTRVTEILIASLDQAQSDLRRINVYDMEEMVFQSSLREGVWEPETLVRVFNLFIRLEARRRVFGDNDLHAITAKIRRLSEIKTESPKQPAHKIWPLQHLESFDDSDVVNPLHFPLSVGDVFERGRRKYILIYPPCDLAVRSTGEREAGIREALLAEIVPEERKNGSWELKHFLQGHRLFVDFKRTHAVKLAVLDFCVYNVDGMSKMHVGEGIPDGIVPSWQKRHSVLQRELIKHVEIFERIGPTAQQRDDITRAVFKCSNDGIFVPSYDAEARSLAYDFKRISRLTEPRSTVLLRHYADFLTREALEHEFETPRPISATVPAEGQDPPEIVRHEP